MIGHIQQSDQVMPLQETQFGFFNKKRTGNIIFLQLSVRTGWRKEKSNGTKLHKREQRYGIFIYMHAYEHVLHTSVHVNK